MEKYREKLTRFLLRAGLSQSEYEQIRDDIYKGNRQNLYAFTAIAAFFLLVMFCLSFVSDDVRDSRWVYMAAMLVMLLLFLVNKYVDLKSVHLLIIMYLFMGILFAFGIVLGTITRPDEQTVTFIALLLTVPLLFTDRPLRMIVNIYMYMFVFIVIAIRVKVGYVLEADIIDAVIFGSISAIISSHMMRVKLQKYLYEQQTGILSRMDVLTGLYNRNYFEHSIMEYISICRKTISCIYMDANGLHELNNTRGHEAGDRMLQFIAESIKKEFGKDTYRIGGDEFVAFAVDMDIAVLEKKLSKIIYSVEKEEYHISIGYDRQTVPEIDMGLLLKNAEKKMYDAKRKFYEQSGNGRIARNF